MTRSAWMAAALLMIACVSCAPKRSAAKPPAGRTSFAPTGYDERKLPPAPGIELFRDLGEKLARQDFDGLDAHFLALEERLAKEPSFERIAQWHYDCFETSDEAVGRQLDAWVAARPQSWAALVCRANHLSHMASILRTTRWSSEVDPDQWQGYNEKSALAAADLEKAIALRPSLLAAYEALLGTSEHHADRTLLDSALRMQPAAFSPRWSYLWYLQPKWGGSMAEMMAFVEESLRYVKDNPRLVALEDRITMTEAEEPWRQGRFAEALAIYEKALGQRLTANLLREHAKMLWELHRLPAAAAELDECLRMVPLSGRNLKERGHLAIVMGDLATARRYLDLKVEHDPLDSGVRFERGVLSYKQGRWDDYLEDNRIVTRYDRRDAMAWNNLGHALLHFQKWAEAEEALTHSIDYGSTWPHTWFKRGKARYMQHKEEAFDDFRAFLDKRKTVTGPEGPPRLAWCDKVMAARGEERWALESSIPE